MRHLTVRSLAASGLAVFLVIASTIGLTQWRIDRWDELAHPATGVPEASLEVPGATREIVYVAEGEPGADRLVAVAMPEGRRFAEYEFAALSPYRHEVSTPNVARQYAFFTETTVEDDLRTFRTSLVRVALDTGERRSLDAGAVEYAGVLVLGGDHEARPEQLTEEQRQARLRSSAHGAARSYAPVVVSDDATTVLLVRPHAGTSSALRVDRFDGVTLAHTGGRTWTEGDPSSRLFTLDNGGVLLVRHEHPDIFSQRKIWTFLDRELRDVATVTGATPFAWPNYCSPDLRSLPDGRTWATICTRDAFGYFLQFIDREQLTDAGQVDLTGGIRVAANLVGWHVATDGTIIVLTDRPSLLRVDPVRRSVVDHQIIRSDSSAPNVRPSSTAIPRAQFSADGRHAYVVNLGSWGSSLSLVDLASSRVLATALHGPGVTGVHLSRDSRRLYAIQEDRLVLLDPMTLRVISITEPIIHPPGAILTVGPGL